MKFNRLICWTVAALLLSPAIGAEWPSCLIVFGHGRNFEPEQPSQNQLWDQTNQRFNQQVLAALQAAGQPATSLVLKVSDTDLAHNLGLLLAESARQGCDQVLETTVFADADAQALRVRLRLYPLQGGKGPRVAEAALHIGEPIHTNQRDFDLSRHPLERLSLGLLGQTMAEESLPAIAARKAR